MEGFKPELLPNNPAGEDSAWEELLDPIEDYIFSVKDDGVRTEIFSDKRILGRSLKPLKSKKLIELAQEFVEIVGFEGVMEAEFYSPNMTFPEIMHFAVTEDVSAPKKVKQYANEWAKTNQGTSTYTAYKTVDGVKEAYEVSWKYPGRTPEWLCQWQDCLQFRIFNHLESMDDTRTKYERYQGLQAMADKFPEYVKVTRQEEYDHIDRVYQAYDQSILDGAEGLVVYRKDCQYKFGRHTLKSGKAYKIKEDNLEFDGVILDVEEATKVREGAEKTVNELGRSVTSKLKEDRLPAGYAKGFMTDLGDGRSLIVSLKGYTVEEKREVLINKDEYIGKSIRFTGMAPVKEGGVPRHAHFTKGNFRDDK